MTIVIAALLGWATLIVLSVQDKEALVLSILLPPIFAVPLIFALRSRSAVLSIFMSFVFVSHAVAPPFFFLRRRWYSYSGTFGAVKAFSFTLGEFLLIYAQVIFWTAAVVIMTYLGLQLIRSRGCCGVRTPVSLTRGGMRFDVAIILFVFLIGIPQSILMYNLRVGITGALSPALPLRLVGILYYSRMFVYPAALFIAYSVSRRRATTAGAILLYSFIAALSGSSRYLLLASAAGAMLFTLVEQRRVRLATITIVIAATFLCVTHSRDFIYTEPDLPLTQLFLNSIRGSPGMQSMNAADFVGAIALRLWGPQDIVLAYQYDVPSRLSASASWFTDRPVMEDLTYEFYGMTFATDSGFGVGIGLIAWMIILARRSYLVLLLLAAVIAALLTLAELAVSSIRSVQTYFVSAAADPLAFFFAFIIYSAASLRWYYELLAAAFVFAILVRVRSRFRRVALPSIDPERQIRQLPVETL